MTAQELGVIRSVLVSSKAIDASASDGDVAAAHAAMLSGPTATEYKAALAAQGVVIAGPNWLTIIGLAGGAVALYFIWKHYKKDKVSEFNRPDPFEQRHQLRGMGKALGSFTRMGSAKSCGPQRMGRFGQQEKKYEFEPERRLEGYRRKARRS